MRPGGSRELLRVCDSSEFAAYGWDPGLSDDELLAKLLELNLGQGGGVKWLLASRRVKGRADGKFKGD